MNSTEAAVGEGIVGIFIAILDSKGCVMLEIPGDSPAPNDSLKKIAAFSLSENKDTLVGGYRVLVECWPHGNLNTDALFHVISDIYMNSLNDYFIEKIVDCISSVNSPENRVALLSGGSPSIFTEAVDLLNHHLKVPNSKKANSFINELNSHVEIPHWIMEEFTSKITNVFCHWNSFLVPQIFTRVTKENAGNYEYLPYTEKSETSSTDQTCKIMLIGLKDPASENISLKPDLNQEQAPASLNSSFSHNRKISGSMLKSNALDLNQSKTFEESSFLSASTFQNSRNAIQSTSNISPFRSMLDDLMVFFIHFLFVYFFK